MIHEIETKYLTVQIKVRTNRKYFTNHISTVKIDNNLPNYTKMIPPQLKLQRTITNYKEDFPTITNYKFDPMRSSKELKTTALYDPSK